MGPVDFTRFDFERISSVIRSLDNLKGAQNNFFVSMIVELAIEKYSDGQLRYIGDTKEGGDYIYTNPLTPVKYECKTRFNLFPRRFDISLTGNIAFKNFVAGSSATDLVKTADFVILVDKGGSGKTKKCSFGISSWEDATENKEMYDGGWVSRIQVDRITMLAKNVQPNFPVEDLGKKINDLIRQSI